MNIYKIYLNYIKEASFYFKEDFNYTDTNEIFLKLTLEPPKNISYGDMSTNIAMLLSAKLKLKPQKIAKKITVYIKKIPGIENVNVAGAGFINIKLNQLTWVNCMENILINQDTWDNLDIGKGKNVNLEYISANPTGPLHAGHARGAVFGDALSSLLIEVGFNVTREYYINDAGSQIDKLVQSSLLRYDEALGEIVGEIPEGLYPGEYLKM